MSEMSQNYTQVDPNKEFRILIATDIHLGFAEKDPIRSEDSFNSFEEVLQIALREKADFLLLGGDLFHENKPSPKSLTKCVEILRKYCMGDSEITFDIVSDVSSCFSHSKYFDKINYLDENLNIQLPVFSIHGNHDDPYGKDSFSVLDILSTTGLLNYFGKQTNMDKIEVSPILLEKNGINIALYGIGSLPEERFHRYIANDKVTFLKVDDNKNWFNIFVVHQNRVRHGTKYLPEHCLTNLPDFVVWGHEHQSKKSAEYNSQQEFYIYQPGSTVATSLCPGEVDAKHVGLLRIRLDEDKEFQLQLTPIKLNTVRQFLLETVNLNAHFEKIGKKHATVLDVEDFLSKKIEKMIKQAEEEHSGLEEQPKLPLIRLRVDYSDEYLTLSSNHFGQRFVGRVANPKDLILFKCKKNVIQKKAILDSNLDMIDEMYEEMYENDGQAKQSNIDDVINEYFETVDASSKLTLLAEKKLTNAVREIVEKDEKSTRINMIIDWHINSIKEHMFKKGDNLDKILTDRTLIREIIQDFKEDLRKKEEQENINLINFEELEGQYKKKPARQTKAKKEDDDDLDETPTKKSTAASRSTAKKTNTTAAKGRGRGKKKTYDTEESDDEIVEVEEKVVATKGKGRVQKKTFDTEESNDDEPAEKIFEVETDEEEEESKTSQFAIIAASSSDASDIEEVPVKKTSAPAPVATTPARGGRGGGRGRGRGRGRGAAKGLSDHFTVNSKGF